LGDELDLKNSLGSSNKNKIWINPGLITYHFDQNKNLNALNYGIGIEYQFSNVSSITAGTFRNSNYETSNYIGMYWQPFLLGPIKLGIVAGGFNGYSSNNNGGWFPAILPALTLENNWIGLNLLIIPTIPNHVAGSFSFQMKFKVFE
jgi:hypothetical protein